MPKKKTNSSKTKPPVGADPVTDYALAVTRGEIVTGPLVRFACQRHLKDLEHGHLRGLVWDVEKAVHVIGFFQTVLKLNGGEFEGQPFTLLGWQAFIIGSLFGWKGPDGFRRFRLAYVETGKGSGKSPLLAGIGLYMQCADDEPRAEVYAAAYKKDQAKVLFRDAVAMVQLSPALASRLRLAGRTEYTNIAHDTSGSFFRPISTEERGKGQSGPRPHCGLLDEIHEHGTNAMVETMRAGTKGRRQALICMITNSGSDRQSVCFEYHQYAEKVCKGELQDDSFFGYVCSLDKGDSPLTDKTCWIKANPSLGHTFKDKYLEDQVNQARGIPSKENFVLRVNFCVWTDAQDGWIGREAWEAVEHPLKLSDYRGRTCLLALDASWTKDLTALAILFPTGKGTFDAFVEYWKPLDNLREAVDHDRVPYDKWAKDGFIHLCPGQVIRLPPIAARIAELAEQFSVTKMAFDRYRLKELPDQLADEGVTLDMVEHPQGFRRVDASPLWMPKSFQELENAIVEKQIRVQVNPVLRWNVASTAVRHDPAGTDNHIPDKRKATGRIDGVTALTMATGLLGVADFVEADDTELVFV